jgi:hypothetical protein
MAVCRNLSKQLVEAPDVYPQPKPAGQPHLIAFDIQPAFADDALQVRESIAKLGAPPRSIQIRPQQRDQLLATMRPARDGKIGEQRQRLAPLDGHSHSIALDARRTEEVNRYVRHLVPLPPVSM